MKRKRSQFRKEVSELEVQHFKFPDESSINMNLTPLYGRASSNQLVVDSVPQPSGPQTTTLTVIGWTGISTPSGVVNDTVFYGYIKQCVLPTLAPGDIVFIDNLSAHKVAGLEELIPLRGAHLIYLPPESADFNPIELVWSKVTTILRHLKARTLPDLIEALKQALQASTSQDIHGWFAHCGYAIN